MHKILEMETFAQINNIPIMEKEGIIFLCEFIKKHQIKTILEIGSAIGYSAIQMCLIDENIKVVSLEKDEVRYKLALQNRSEIKLDERIDFILADALDFEIEEKFDLIFIDAAKAQYTKFFKKYEKNLNEGGYIISDNLGFHGLVEDHDKIKTRNIRQLIRKLEDYHVFLNDNEVYKTRMYKVGDTVGVSQKYQQKIQGVIFDMDGILVDSEVVAARVSNEYAATLGFQFDDAYFKRIIGTTKAHIKGEFDTYVNYKFDFEEFYHECNTLAMNFYAEKGLLLKEGVLELLAFLDEHHIKKIVATSSMMEHTILKLKYAGLDQYFDQVITGNMVTNSKPHPEIFLKAQEMLGIDRKRLLILEDSINGVNAALNAGIRVIMVPDMLEPTPEIMQEAFMIKDSLIDVLQYLKESIR